MTLLTLKINKNKNIVSDLRKQQKLMTIYASDNVLKAWSEFKFTVMNSILNKKGLSKEEKTSFYIKNEAPYAEKLIAFFTVSKSELNPVSVVALSA